MSSRTFTTKFTHYNDCEQQGCPSHVLSVTYHLGSDTVSLFVDDEHYVTFDSGTLNALQEILLDKTKWL